MPASLFVLFTIIWNDALWLYARSLSFARSRSYTFYMCFLAYGCSHNVHCKMYNVHTYTARESAIYFGFSFLAFVWCSEVGSIFFVKCPFCFLCAVICSCINSITASQMRVLLYNLSVYHHQWRSVWFALLCFILSLSNSILCAFVCTFSFICFLNSRYFLVGGIFTTCLCCVLRCVVLGSKSWKKWVPTTTLYLCE